MILPTKTIKKYAVCHNTPNDVFLYLKIQLIKIQSVGICLEVDRVRPLSQNDCRNLSSALEKIYGIPSLKAFPSGVLLAVRQLIPCNTACYNEVVLPNTIATWIAEPANALPGPILKEMFMRHYSEHPALAYYAQTGDERSYRISDFISRCQFHNLTLFNEYYRPSNVEYQILTGIRTSPNQMVGIALDRDCTDFTEDERLSLDLLRPHLVQAYRNLETLNLMQKVAERGAEKVIIMSRSGQVRIAGDDVWRTLGRYFDLRSSSNSLPEVLVSWVRCERSRFSDDCDVPSPSIPLIATRGNQKLISHFIWGGNNADQDIILLTVEHGELNPDLLIESGLTHREDEVLVWLSQGKTNAEIGQILSISPRAVKKHLEHVYGKLQVHRRSAAIARSLQL